MFEIAGGILLAMLMIALLPVILRIAVPLMAVAGIGAFVLLLTSQMSTPPKPQAPATQSDLARLSARPIVK
jgi:hypothetical protein